MPQRLSRAWRNTLARLLGSVAIALIVGVAIDQVWPVLAMTLAVMLAWHYAQVYRLLQRDATAAASDVEPAPGVATELEALLERPRRSNRKRERKLVGLLRAFRQAAAALPDAAVALDGEKFRVRWFNEAATRLLGLRYPQDLGLPLDTVLRTPRVAAWLADGGAETLMDLPSPVDESLRLSLRLIGYGNGQKLLVARDMSKLAHLEQVRRDFVANVSHELRTPLTVVHGYLDLIDPQDIPEYAGMLGEMRTQSRRMTQIVEDLLTLSRLEVQETLDEERVAMRSLLDSLRRDALALSAGRHTVELDDAAPFDLLGSAKELHSAFSNLVSNAVRYTPPGGRIRLAFEREGDGARLAVTDTGHGIPPQHIPRITERFYRVSTSRSRETGGTGLGLSIVKHVLNLHHARLSIESDVGRGSTFTCHFRAASLLPRECDTGEAA